MDKDDYMMLNKCIIEFIVCIWNGYLIISLLTKLWIRQKNAQNSASHATPKAILYSAIAAFVGFPICYTIKLIVYITNPTPTNSIKTLNLSVVWFSFAVSRLSFYCFMLSRLYHSFHATEEYKISNRILYIHIAIILMTPFYIAIMICLQGLNVNDMYYIYGSIICIVILLFGSIHILVMFNKRLYGVILKHYMHHSPNNSQSCKTVNRVFTVIVRNTILTCCTILMFILFVILYAIFSFVELNTVQWTILAYLQVITINIASLCIYLSFSVNRKIYGRCCAVFQRNCESLCGEMVKKDKVIQARSLHVPTASKTKTTELINGNMTPMTDVTVDTTTVDSKTDAQYKD